MNHFFYFISEPMSQAIQLTFTDKNIDPLKLIKGDLEEYQQPIEFKQVDGKKLGDILDAGYPGLYLISKKLQGVLFEKHLTGWRTFPVNVCDKEGYEILGYQGLSVTGRSGPTYYKQSQIIEKRRVPTGPICRFYKGVFVDHWNGTDFFTPEGTYQIFVTSKTAELLVKNKITNLCLENLADSEISVQSVKPEFRLD